MEKAKFCNLSHIPGEGGRLVQGVKNHRTPKGALYGGNGSFVVKGRPVQLNLTVKTEDGKIFQNSIVEYAKEKYGRSRITEAFVNKLWDELPSTDFTVDDKGKIRW